MSFKSTYQGNGRAPLPLLSVRGEEGRERDGKGRPRGNTVKGVLVLEGSGGVSNGSSPPLPPPLLKHI